MNARTSSASMTAVLLICAPLLTACGPAKPRLEPPSVRIVQLQLEQPGSTAAQAFELTIRVRNGTDAVLPSHRLSIDLSLDAAGPIHFDKQVEQDIPPQGREVVVFNGELSSQSARALTSLANGERGQLPYRLEGLALTEDDELEFEYEGWLSSTPGKPGSFR